MANWEKLNKEFDDALDSMTSEDWELWASKRVKQTTRTMKKEIKLWLTSLFLKWAMNTCPEGNFKNNFSLFLRENITNL
jgi:hypothetical protein